MKSLDKERRKLEKAGFSGQTLEQAMELLERTNASILAEILVKMVTKQEKTPSMALHEMAAKTRELEAKLGFPPKAPRRFYVPTVSPADRHSNQRFFQFAGQSQIRTSYLQKTTPPRSGPGHLQTPPEQIRLPHQRRGLCQQQ